MPQVDESALPNNVKAESGLQPLWEDEDMADPGATGSFLLRDSGLLTRQKCDSFTKEQAKF